MRILQRYVAFEILKSFAFALVVFTAVFFVGVSYKLVRSELPFGKIIEVIPFAVAYTIPYILPISLLVGIALGLGRVAADNEVVAVRSGGYHLAVLIAPALAVGAIASSLLMYFNGNVIPYCYYAQKNLARQFVEELRTLGTGENKRISEPRRFELFCRRYSGARLDGIQIVLPKGVGDRPTEIVAERGELGVSPSGEALVLDLEQVTATIFVVDEKDLGEFTIGAGGRRKQKKDKEREEDDAAVAPLARRVSFDRAKAARLPLAIPIEFLAVKERIGIHPNVELRRIAERLEAWIAWRRTRAARLEAALGVVTAGALAAASPGAPATAAVPLAGAQVIAASPGKKVSGWVKDRLKDARSELHQRHALALASFLFALVGAPLPLLLNHNNRLVPFFIAFLTVGATFFLPLIAGRRLAEEEVLDPIIALYAGPALTLVAGLFLLWRLFRT